MATVPPIVNAAPEEDLLVRIARAVMERERQKLGIPAQEQKAELVDADVDLKRAQAAYYLQGGRQSVAKPPRVGSPEYYLIRKYGPNPTPEQIAEGMADLAKAGQAPQREPNPPTNLEAQAAAALASGDNETYQRLLRVKKEMGQADDKASSPRTAISLQLPVAVMDKQTGQMVYVSKEDAIANPDRYVPPPTATQRNVEAGVLSAQERKDKSGLEQALEGAGELRRLLPTVRDNIGVVAGNIASLKRKTVGASPEVQELFRTSDRLAEFLLRALSGAQINESEYGRLRSLIPNPREHISKFESDLNLFEREIKSTLARRFPYSQQGGQPAAPDSPTAPAGGLDPAVQRILDMIRSRNAGQ